MTAKTRTFDPDRDITAQDNDDAVWGTHRPSQLQALLIGIGQQSFLSRGSFRHWFTNFICGFGRPLDVMFRGCRYRIDGTNNLIEYGLLLRKDYNGEELDFLLAGLAPGGTVVDVGCNIGLYSLPLEKAVGPSGRVVSIDANAAMIARLETNARLSKATGVTSVHTAVGGHAGRVDLNIRKDDVAIVSVVESQTGMIPMYPLETVLRNAGVTQVDVLKIDIEGHEDAALVPYLDAVSDAMRPDRIVIEHPSPSADYAGCAAAFERHGYRLVGRTRANSLYQRGVTGG